MTAATSVLAELEQRSGASDQNRAEWLKERHNGVTATQVRDLVLAKRKGAAALRQVTQQLIDEKLGRRPEPDLSSVPVIGWGRDREPVIAAYVRDAFAIEPETRLFRAADNARLLASPDGLGVNFDGELVAEEIKTGSKLKPIGSHDFEVAGHGIQMTWVMRVTGARAALYVQEERLGRSPEFRPGELVTEWFFWDEALAAECEGVATAFLAELDAQAAGAEPEAVDVDDALDTLAVNYLRYQQAEAEAGKAKKAAGDEMKALLRGRGLVKQEGVIARLHFEDAREEPVVSTEVDEDAAMEADYGLWQEFEDLRQRWEAHRVQFVREVPTTKKKAETFRVTPVKAKEMDK